MVTRLHDSFYILHFHDSIEFSPQRKLIDDHWPGKLSLKVGWFVKIEWFSRNFLILALNVTVNASGITCIHAGTFVMYPFAQNASNDACFCHQFLDNVRELCCKYSREWAFPVNNHLSACLYIANGPHKTISMHVWEGIPVIKWVQKWDKFNIKVLFIIYSEMASVCQGKRCTKQYRILKLTWVVYHELLNPRCFSPPKNSLKKFWPSTWYHIWIKKAF